MLVSVIVPVFNEEESLFELYEEVSSAIEREKGLELELVFVDDGSRDASWKRIGELTERDPRVTGVKLRRNFGKAAALQAGMLEAAGEVLFSMDADLQDDPAEIGAMIELLDEGFDVVNGWKSRRLDPWHKVYPSKVFNYLVGKLTGLKLHDHNCGLKCFRAEVAHEIELYGELHRFVPVLAHSRGFRVTEKPVNHRPRVHGNSKYGVKRFARGLLDLMTVSFLTEYGRRPQHFLGGIGLGLFLLGSLGLGFLACVWLATHLFGVDAGPIGQRPLLAYSAAFTLLGAQILSLGLVAELVLFHTAESRKPYSVADVRRGSDHNGNNHSVSA